MRTTSISSFDYNLPNSLIASSPLDKRADSRMLHYNLKGKKYNDYKFSELLELLNAGDLLILNNTKVIPARIYMQKQTGGKIEILFNKKINNKKIEVIFSSSRPPKHNSLLCIKKENLFKVISLNGKYLILETICDESFFSIFQSHGEIPLPKYIKRPVNDHDKEKYQTVYACEEGSVAAPTAGLHFTTDMINKLINKGVVIKHITLHISYNTFKPISVENYLEHELGSEYIEIDESVFKCITDAKISNSRIIAVGTTVARTLEFCYANNIKKSFYGYIDLFIYPGFKFQSINCLITNFHLPMSSLLLLVCAFAGKEKILNVYAYAVKQKYRFYSYGDSMFLENR